MSACQKHPKFNIKQGVYFRAANPDKPSDWLPNSDVKRQTYYNFAAGGDMDEMAALMGEAQMIHSNESSIGSGFVSAARCPVCLLQTTDPTVKKILALGFNNYYSCNQTRVCWRYSKIQINHPWTDFKYTASDSYDQERTCTRCNQKGKRTAPHNWGKPEERAGSTGFFDFVKCFTGFHDWTAWGFYIDNKCNQTRVCRRCWRYSKIQINHSWTVFKYITSDSCEQERTCKRCNQKGKRTAPHNWGEPEERDHVHDDYIYKCKRCKETDCRPYFYD